MTAKPRRLAPACVLLLAALAAGADALQAQQRAAPDDARFAASSRGQVYYPIACAAWRELSPRNLIFFPSADSAEAAGYRPTRNRRCVSAEAPAALDLPASAVAERASPRHRVAGGCIVVRILDGDTVDCAGGARIRLLLIDAPETAQGSYGLRARLALEELLPLGDTAAVEVDVQERDRYGRVLGHLHARGVWLNRALVREGYAVPLVYPPNVRWVEEIRAAADSARVERKGLWEADAFRCLPVDYRAGRCGKEEDAGWRPADGAARPAPVAAGRLQLSAASAPGACLRRPAAPCPPRPPGAA